MSQSFNVRPYNDDYDEKKHFYRVLFRPSVAVQARELTQAQSILQQQIKYLGDSIYKHGSMVIPGQVATDPKTNYVRLQATYGYLGPDPIPINLDLFTSKVIQGLNSGLKAQVVHSTVAVNTDSPTLFVKYLNTGINGETVFPSSEVLTLENSTTGLALVESADATGLAISAQIDEGVYYCWGFFVRVEKQYLLLNKYSNVASLRVGLQINETIVTPEEDISLTDNAQGSTNYAAPGAHRYKIDLILTSKDLEDNTSDENFIELVRLVNSKTQKKVLTDTYSVIAKEMAQRMDDANGDFAVRNFAIDVREHLDTSFVTEGTVLGASVATTSPVNPAKIILATSASTIDDAYKNFQLYLTNGPGAGQNFTITSYVGSSKTAVLDEDFAPNKVPDITSTYIVSDPTKINRGIYSPPHIVDGVVVGTGVESKLAVGMESGRAYVDGYRIDTLSTVYVDVDKARDTAQAVNSLVNVPIGNYILVKNLHNIPLAAATANKDFLTINFSNLKASSSFNAQNGLGTARVHTIEYVQGSISASPSTAVFKMYLFDVKMNNGQSITNVRSFFLSNEIQHNNCGNSLNAWGDVCAVFNATNVNGNGLVPGVTITGPSGIGTEVLVTYDAINNVIITEPNGTNVTQILNSGTFTAPNSTTGQLSARREMFETGSASLVYPMPQKLVKTVRASDNSVRTSYYIRQMFESQRNSSGDYIFNSAPSAPFGSFSPRDYVACIVSDPTPGNIGKFVDLTGLLQFGGNPANTTLTIHIASGLGSGSGCIMKLMATVYRTASSERLKALTSATIAFPNPTANMSLQKADIVTVTKIIDSGSPGVDADPSNPAHVDIKNRYVLDDGQRDYYYDVGSVILRPGQAPPSGRVLVMFEYFAHSGSGDYFSVDSYTNQSEYAQIPTYQGSNGVYYPLRDCLDFRPRRDNLGFGFSATGSSYSAPVLPNSTLVTDYQYYLGRIDKVYVDQYGNFNVVKGTSGVRPLPPSDPLDGMMLYTLTLHPYTLTTTDLDIKATKNPRYTMHDIGKLEDRINNLEYYVNLSQLEQKTATFQVTDTNTGLDRFKNGFVVDNFRDHGVGNVFDSTYRCSVDPAAGILRPLFTQIHNDLVFQASPSSGYEYRSGLLILQHTETITIEQKFATDIVNINPFSVFTYHGDLALNPPTDTWKDTVQRPVINVDDKTAMDGYKFVNQWSGTVWNDWQTAWVGVPQSTTSVSTQTVVSNNGGQGQNVAHNWAEFQAGAAIPAQDAAGAQAWLVANDPNHWVWQNNIDIVHINGQAYAFGPDGAQVNVPVKGAGGGGPVTTTTTTTTVNTTQQVGQIRSGAQTLVTAQLSSQKINNQLVDSSLSPYIRSRRIKIIGRHFKPNTRLYPFFDGVDVSAFCRPFQDLQLTPSLSGASWTSQAMTWGGDFNPQSNMNVGHTEDTGDTGQTATYLTGPLNEPIMTDSIGTCTLFFEIPSTDSNKFRVGYRPFRLTTSAINKDNADAYGDANYNASGLVDQYQQTITSIWSPKIETRQVSDSKVITQNLGSTTSTVTNTSSVEAADINLTLWVDPLAQSILIKDKGGCYVTKVAVYFQSRDESVPVTLQIRNLVNGYPGQEVVPFSEKTLYPNDPVLSSMTVMGDVPSTMTPYSPQVIDISDDASVPTFFYFDAPVYLNDGTEYAIVLIANSIKYNVYTAKIGGTVVGSTNIVSTPPYLGSIFKSQNASTWVADPSQNLKFQIYKAVFEPANTGEVYFTNGSVQADTLLSMPFTTVATSNTVRVKHYGNMMPKGQYVNSVVKLSNIAPGTYNGLTDVQLTGTFSIDNVDLDSYTITVPGSAALATGRTGPDGVSATRNQQYDSMCLMANTLTPSGTGIDWFIKTITGKSVHNNSGASQEPYTMDTEWTPIAPNTTIDFLVPHMIASDVNETTNIPLASVYDRKSFKLKAVIATSSDNLTPIVDIGRMGLVLASNRLDDPTFANYTLDPMDAGVVVTSSSAHPLIFASQVVVTVVAVTGGQFQVGEQVLGAVSGATGTVASWDSMSLILNAVTGQFLKTEAISGAAATGTVEKFEYLNTITDWNTLTHTSGLDFTPFIPGYAMTIVGATSNPYGFNKPVTILGVNGNVITVQANPPFVSATNQVGVDLTQYTRFVAESGPSNCTAASRYITRQFTLANPANSLKVLFTINRPPGAYVDCYYRIQRTDSTASFDSVIWKPIDLDSTVDNGESSNPNEFKEYVYTANNIGSFIAFSIKLVMRGGNTSRPPKIRDFRGIALAT